LQVHTKYSSFDFAFTIRQEDIHNNTQYPVLTSSREGGEGNVMGHGQRCVGEMLYAYQASNTFIKHMLKT
jgi:hypothetical protein